MYLYVHTWLLQYSSMYLEVMYMYLCMYCTYLDTNNISNVPIDTTLCSCYPAKKTIFQPQICVTQRKAPPLSLSPPSRVNNFIFHRPLKSGPWARFELLRNTTCTHNIFLLENGAQTLLTKFHFPSTQELYYPAARGGSHPSWRRRQIGRNNTFSSRSWRSISTRRRKEASRGINLRFSPVRVLSRGIPQPLRVLIWQPPGWKMCVGGGWREKEEKWVRNLAGAQETQILLRLRWEIFAPQKVQTRTQISLRFFVSRRARPELCLGFKTSSFLGTSFLPSYTVVLHGDN